MNDKNNNGAAGLRGVRRLAAATAAVLAIAGTALAQSPNPQDHTAHNHPASAPSATIRVSKARSPCSSTASTARARASASMSSAKSTASRSFAARKAHCSAATPRPVSSTSFPSVRRTGRKPMAKSRSAITTCAVSPAESPAASAIRSPRGSTPALESRRSAAASPRQLPFTGADLPLMALLGVTALAAGMVLRRRPAAR